MNITPIYGPDEIPTDGRANDQCYSFSVYLTGWEYRALVERATEARIRDSANADAYTPASTIYVALAPLVETQPYPAPCAHCGVRLWVYPWTAEPFRCALHAPPPDQETP